MKVIHLKSDNDHNNINMIIKLLVIINLGIELISP